MRHLVFVLIASSWVALCSNIHRRYILVVVGRNWDAAQSYCRYRYTDLITIATQVDMRRLMNMVEGFNETREVWIGLKQTGPTSWLWSIGETTISQGLAEYTNWASLPDPSHHCGGMRNDGKWSSASCNTSYPFVCQNDEKSSGLYVVLLNKTWREAQLYCRLNHSDLASARNLKENQALHLTIGSVGPTFFWIGLFRDEWKWSDGSNSSFRSWATEQPNHDGACALYSPSRQSWGDRGCSDSHPFFCYFNIVPVKRRYLRVEVKSAGPHSSKFDDSAVSEALLKKIQDQSPGIEFQWRVQPDGKIFKKQEKEKVIEDCDMK